MAPRPRPWFRFYTEAVNDPKLRRVQPALRWLWVAVLALARKSPIPGVLVLTTDGPGGVVTIEDLADFAGVKLADAKAGVQHFIDVRMLHVDEDLGAWVVTKWDGRQYESDDVTARTRKARRNGTTMERSNDAASNDDGTSHERPSDRSYADDGTPPESESESESESEVGESSSTHVAVAATATTTTICEVIADQRIARLATPPTRPNGYRRTVVTDVQTEHGQRIAALVAERPDLEPAAIATIVEPPTQARPPDPVDRTAAATRARDERLAARQRGEACKRCDGTGVAELEDGSFDRCPECQP